MINISGMLMSKDTIIAQITNGDIVSCDEKMLPLLLKKTRDIESWLASRAIDSHRTNSRLLKKALRLKNIDDVSTVLSVNAATITDCYWFKPEGSNLTYADVVFKKNDFAELSLLGLPDTFNKATFSATKHAPDLTLNGSYEKCWKLSETGNSWIMLKEGTSAEKFSELFCYHLCKSLNFDVAKYWLDESGAVATEDFTAGRYNYEAIEGLVGDNDDYRVCFDALFNISQDIAAQYLKLIWFDTLVFNVDRHTKNFGVIRDQNTGEILKLAPNFDNNLSLIARGLPKDMSRDTDGLIKFWNDFLRESPEARLLLHKINLPKVTASIMYDAMSATEIKLSKEETKGILVFIANGNELIHKKRNDISLGIE